MKRRIKRALKQLLLQPVVRSGLPVLLQQTLWRRGLTIVTYHGIVPAPLPVPDWCFLDAGAFTEQVRYLGERFAVAPLEEAAAMLAEGRIERPTAAITFDDGFQSVHDVAFPILRSMGLPATVFLNTGLCGTADTVWFCRLHGAICRTARSVISWRGQHLDLRSRGLRARASSLLQARLKDLSHIEMGEEVRRIIAGLGDDPDAPLPPESPYRMLSVESARALDASGLVSLGAHTHDHAILTRIDEARRQEEIEGSLRGVSDLTGRPCRVFAYPNGRRQDYDPGAVALLRALGVRVAVTSVPGPNVMGTSPLELCRYGVGADMTMTGFRCLVHHLASPA